VKEADGKDISKKALKDCQKRMTNHGKAVDKLTKAAKGDVPAYIEAIKADIVKLKSELGQ
jgi:hypothetical protein